MLSFSSFSKKYDHRLILDIGSVELPEGIVWLKGMNGVGKSTLMRCAAGIIPFRGDVSLIRKGYSLRKTPSSYRQYVNMSEAEPVFPAFLKGIEIVRFFRQAKQGNEEQLADLVERLHARSFIEERVGTYSSGMSKKLSLILAFIGKPDVILLDEPFTTLDQPTQAALYDIIASRSEEGVGVLISSHQDLVFSGSVELHKMTLHEGRLETE